MIQTGYYKDKEIVCVTNDNTIKMGIYHLEKAPDSSYVALFSEGMGLDISCGSDFIEITSSNSKKTYHPNRVLQRIERIYYILLSIVFPDNEPTEDTFNDAFPTGTWDFLVPVDRNTI